jgi:hypothetical protein
MFQNSIVILTIVGFIAWYYFNKFQDSEKEYFSLHQKYMHLCNENQKLKARVSDLDTYKTDVSKTFQILDNELVLINDHIKQRNSVPLDHLGGSTERSSTQRSVPQRGRVSILTPELLTTLFTNINQEQEQPQDTNDTNETGDVDTRNIANVDNGGHGATEVIDEGSCSMHNHEHLEESNPISPNITPSSYNKYLIE